MRSSYSSSSLLSIGLVGSVILYFQSGVKAQARETEASEATISIPSVECTPYNYPPVSKILGYYPDTWDTASLQKSTIPQSDRDVYDRILPTIPNINPRVSFQGDLTNVTYSGPTDPDCWWSYTQCTTPHLAGLEPDITRCLEPNSWGFTLDDGPNCSHNAYFDYLFSIKQKATLFYIGSNVINWPLEAQRGLADGHDICAHTWSHPYMTALTNEQVFAELYYSKKAIKDVLGVTVQCWRPPFGDVDDRVRFIAQALGMKTVLWEDDTDDFGWVTKGYAYVRANYNKILSQQANGTYKTAGTIVLTHEINNGTMALSQEFLPRIQKQFTGGVLPINVCMNDSQPYVEGASFTYPNYAAWMTGERVVHLADPVASSGQTILQLPNSASSINTNGSPANTPINTGNSASSLNNMSSSVAFTTATRSSQGPSSKPSSDPKPESSHAQSTLISYAANVVPCLAVLALYC